MILKLTAREAQVLRLVVEGHLYKTAANVLGVSHRTVEALSRAAQARNDCKTLPQIAARFAVASLTGSLQVSKVRNVTQTRQSKPVPTTHAELMTAWSSEKGNQK